MWHRKIEHALIYDNLEHVIESPRLELHENTSRDEINKIEK
jgi:hypothetical protein